MRSGCNGPVEDQLNLYGDLGDPNLDRHFIDSHQQHVEQQQLNRYELHGHRYVQNNDFDACRKHAREPVSLRTTATMTSSTETTATTTTSYFTRLLCASAFSSALISPEVVPGLRLGAMRS